VHGTQIEDPCSDSTVLDPELGPKGARFLGS
jgi:hypothetical protein